MDTANIRTLFDSLLDAGPNAKLTVNNIEGFTNYETLRTALVKHWTAHKDIIGAIGIDDDPQLSYGLCGNFNAEENSAVFWIGTPRTKAPKLYSFSIVPAKDGEEE